MLHGQQNSKATVVTEQPRVYYLLYYNKERFQGKQTNLRPKNHESPDFRQTTTLNPSMFNTFLTYTAK